ncbi:MAG: sugar porter family MFS transporter [Gammaproteobacteria bacterium]|nr:sugar porter family MFS transporter [Gammaproteobacteria bacterium]
MLNNILVVFATLLMGLAKMAGSYQMLIAGMCHHDLTTQMRAFSCVVTVVAECIFEGLQLS